MTSLLMVVVLFELDCVADMCMLNFQNMFVISSVLSISLKLKPVVMLIIDLILIL